MCHVSCVTCHMSRVTCSFFYIIIFFFGPIGGASQWRVCYQRGVPRLVSLLTPFKDWLCEQNYNVFQIHKSNEVLVISVKLVYILFSQLIFQAQLYSQLQLSLRSDPFAHSVPSSTYRSNHKTKGKP